MACIGIFQAARLRAELSIEERDEPICTRNLVNDVIKASEQIVSARESRRIHAQDHFDGRHQPTGRDPFAGHVSDNRTNLPVRQFEESIVVSATILAGYSRAANSNPGTAGID